MYTSIIALFLISVVLLLYVLKKYVWFIASVCIYLTIPIDIITPVMNIGSHYLLLILLGVITLIEFRNKNIYLTQLTKWFLITWTAFFVACVIGFLLNGRHNNMFGATIKFIGIIAFVIETTLLIVLSQLLSKEQQIKAFKKYIIIFVCITSVFVLLQIYVESIGIPITKAIMHSGSLDVLIQKGFFTRALGMTPSPVMLASLFLIILTIMLTYSVKKEVPFYYYIFFVFAGFIMLLSNTKTAILGLPIAVIIGIVLECIQKTQLIKKLKKIVVLTLCFTIILSSWAFLIPERLNYIRNSYISYLGPNISTIFETRKEAMIYDNEVAMKEFENSNTGYINEDTKDLDNSDTNNIQKENANDVDDVLDYKNSSEIIRENWLFGVGPMSTNGEYFTDMSYIAILHNGGVVAFCCLAVFYVMMFIRSIKKKQEIVCGSLLITALIFLGFSWYISATYIPFIAFAILMLQNNREDSKHAWT